MTDIPSLIERLRAWSRDQEGSALAEDLTEAAEALSRLTRTHPAFEPDSDVCMQCGKHMDEVTVSPLSGEIAKLIERLVAISDGADIREDQQAELQIAAAALELMARKNAELEEYVKQAREIELLKYEQQTARTLADMLRARVTELEAERDRCRETNQVLMGQWEDACRERDIVKAKTIEECAKIGNAAAEALRLDEKRYSRAGYLALVDLVTAIRALNQPSASGIDKSE